MEIYNEDINDLFAVENQKLQIHESLDVSYGKWIIYFHKSILMSKKTQFIFLPAWSFCRRTEGGNCK